MDSLTQYIAEHANQIYTTIITFFSVYGVAIFSLVVGIINTKLKAIKANEKATERMNEIIDTFTAKLNEMEQKVIEASNINTTKRIEAMQKIAESVNAANEALEDYVPTTEENTEVDEAIAKIN